MPTAVRSLVAALAVTALVVGGGVALNAPDEERPTVEEPAPTVTLADLDTTTLAASRTGFCDAITDAQVADALGEDAAGTASYENGDKVSLAGDLTDVAHEFGCSWTGADGAEARGWVFAPPVTARQARRLARTTARAEGCERIADAADLGSPSVGVRCTEADTVVVSHRGLLGDAWLACSLSGPDEPDLAERADRWCAAVVQATS